MKKYRLGILGAGNMGLAIARGAVNAGRCTPSEILLMNLTSEKRAARAAEGFAVTGSQAELYGSCEQVVLGIKPQIFDAVLPMLAAAGVAEKPLVISIAAGVSFAKMEAVLGADCPIIRVMPNTPLLLGLGASALVRNAAALPEQLENVRALFGSMGITVVFEEEKMLNEVIPYNGSAPAYVYAFIDGMARSAQEHGIAREQALELISKTCIGAAEMVLQSGKTTAELIREVCSPGGTTIEAVKVLEGAGLNAILAEASDRCIARAYELGK